MSNKNKSDGKPKNYGAPWTPRVSLELIREWSGRGVSQKETVALNRTFQRDLSPSSWDDRIARIIGRDKYNKLVFATENYGEVDKFGSVADKSHRYVIKNRVGAYLISSGSWTLDLNKAATYCADQIPEKFSCSDPAIIDHISTIRKGDGILGSRYYRVIPIVGGYCTPDIDNGDNYVASVVDFDHELAKSSTYVEEDPKTFLPVELKLSLDVEKIEGDHDQLALKNILRYIVSEVEKTLLESFRLREVKLKECKASTSYTVDVEV